MTRRTYGLWLAAVALALALPPDATAQIVTGLQGCWQFNGTGNDTSGNGRNLTLVGSPGFAAGLFGQALDLHHNNAQYATRPTGDAAVRGRMDLVSAVAHELGHPIGLDPDGRADDVMGESLAAGVRRLPTKADVLTATPTAPSRRGRR